MARELNATVQRGRWLLLAVTTAVTIALVAASGVATGVAAVTHVPAAAQKGCVAHSVHGQQVTICMPTALAKRVDQLLTSKHFSGAMLLAYKGRVLLNKTYGLANRKTKTPNMLTTKMPIAGISGSMAAVGIVKLIEQRKLLLTSKLCSYLPGCPKRWRPITVKQLLTATAGLGGYEATQATGGIQRTLKTCESLPLQSTPGTTFAGSDCYTVVKGLIIEKVSGLTWAKFMQRTIFQPAGMTNSGQMTNAFLPPRRATGTAPGRVPGSTFDYDGYFLAYSSPQDVYRYDKALLDGKIVSAKWLAAIFAPHAPEPGVSPTGDTFYSGYGFDVIKASKSTIAHTVTAGGYEQVGFSMTDFLSRNGTIGIEMNNDLSKFSNNDENAFWDLMVRLSLYQKR